jgi:GT2 family glycosyltransferase
VIFWELFLRLLPRKPRPALAALYWYVTRRRVRARNRLQVASIGLHYPYRLWIRRVEAPAAARALAKGCAHWQFKPRFSIVLLAPGGVDPRRLDRSIRSINIQSYPIWTVVRSTPDSIGPVIAASDGDFVVPLRAGHALSPNALFRMAEALQTDPEASILYGDQDMLALDGTRSEPWFKPRWNEEMFYAQDFLSGAAAIRASVARAAADSGGTSLAELMLAATSLAEERIVHVPHVLVHADRPPFASDDMPSRIGTVAHHIAPSGGTSAPGPFGSVRVRWPLPDPPPLVSIIVPTKDQSELLRACIESVLSKTDYDPFEVLIIDNGSVEPQTAALFAEVADDPRIRVLKYPGAYNFSAINNFAAREARGSFLCLLNNDTEVLTAAWLSEMMRYAARNDVGAVGAKLLYEDGTIQHAGVVIGIGGAAGHAHRFLANDDPGYFRQAHVAQFVSAVTAACLVIERRKFFAVGGLDDENLAVAFNDVDLCLKLEAAGFRNVYVPHATLIHHESKSRGKDIAPENIHRYRGELQVLRDRWMTRSYNDPLHNPNLDRANETFVIGLLK